MKIFTKVIVDNKVDLKKELKELKELKITYRSFGLLCGLNFSVVSKICNGKIVVSENIGRKVMSALEKLKSK